MSMSSLLPLLLLLSLLSSRLLLLLAVALAPSQDRVVQSQAHARGLLDGGVSCPSCNTPGAQCLQWSSGVAARIADYACTVTFDSRCSEVASLMGLGPQLAPVNCYTGVTKDDCVSQATSYAKASVSSACSLGYNAGAGSCDASAFQSYFAAMVEELCGEVAKGAAVPWR